MNKTVVVYKSKYGATKKYAEWIASELKSDIFEASKITASDLKNYSNIIFGGGLYAGSISGINIIVKNFNEIKDKEIIVFTCGIADTKNEDNVKVILGGIDKIITPEMKEKIVFFHLRGWLDFSKLGFVHKAMMGMMKKILSKKTAETLTADDKIMLESFGKMIDFTDQSSISSIVEYCRKL